MKSIQGDLFQRTIVLFVCAVSVSAPAGAQARYPRPFRPGRPQPSAAVSQNTSPGAPAEPDLPRLTPFRAALLTIRDNPAVLTDDAMVELTKSQVIAEHNAWESSKRLTARSTGRASYNIPNPNLNPIRSSFTFEWQKLMNSDPDFARGPLLNVFMRPDADWSFVKNERGWDEHYDSFVDAFVFPREKVDGRDTRFAAAELAPVYKQFLQLAASKAPTNVWFSVPLPAVAYDFKTRAMRFIKQAQSGGDYLFFDKVDLLSLIDGVVFQEPPAGSRDWTALLPARARSTANYWIIDARHALRLDEAPLVKPGMKSDSASEGPRKAFVLAASSEAIPSLSILAFDRQLQLSAISLDARRAEALTNTVPPEWQARVYIEVERAELVQWRADRERRKQAMLFARVQKVDIVAKNGELIASLSPEGLPAPVAPPDRRLSTPSSAVPTKPASENSNETFAEQMRRLDEENNARARRISEQVQRNAACQQRAAKVNPHLDSPEYQQALKACLAKPVSH